MHIVLITADQSLQQHISQLSISDSSISITPLRTGGTLRQLKSQMAIDAVLIDGDLPEDAIGLCRSIRVWNELKSLPVLMLVPPGQPFLVTESLDAGADDCICKPFETRLLAARLRALIRRLTPRLSTSIIFHGDQKHVTVGDRVVTLTRIEYMLLEEIGRTQGQHITAETLLQSVWSYPEGAGDTALVRNHIRNIREKLELDPLRPRYLISRHGRGYTLEVDAVRYSS